MKIEVGKTYIDNDGDKIKIVAFEPAANEERPYLGIYGPSTYWFDENGETSIPLRLFSERTEPRVVWIELARRVVYLTREDATVDECECPTLYREVRS